MSYWIFPLIFLIIFESIADIFAKEYAIRRQFHLASISILLYIICSSFWLIALRNGAELSRGAVLFSVASAILACCIGVGYYREQLTITEWIGILLGLASIGLLIKHA
jgi:multidrug transporter EmrE-like cation transporter